MQSVGELLLPPEPPVPEDPAWGRITQGLAQFQPGPDVADLLLTLLYFRADMVQFRKNGYGGLGGFYYDARSNRRVSHLPDALRAAGLPEAAERAQAARDQYRFDDRELPPMVRAYMAADPPHPTTLRLKELSGELAEMPLDRAVWDLMRQPAILEQIAHLPAAASPKAGFFARLFGRG